MKQTDQAAINHLRERVADPTNRLADRHVDLIESRLDQYGTDAPDTVVGSTMTQKLKFRVNMTLVLVIVAIAADLVDRFNLVEYVWQLIR